MKEDSAILELYEMVEEREAHTSLEYKKIQRELIKLREKFNQNLTEEQKEELNVLMTLKNDMASVECKEFFFKGYSRATKTMAEVFYNDKMEEE